MMSRGLSTSSIRLVRAADDREGSRETLTTERFETSPDSEESARCELDPVLQYHIKYHEKWTDFPLHVRTVDRAAASTMDKSPLS